MAKKIKNVGNNDSAVEAQNAKPVFNLTTAATKTNQNNNSTSNQNSNKNNNESKPASTPYKIPSSNRRRFTPLGQSLELALKELLEAKVITLLKARDYNPQVKPS